MHPIIDNNRTAIFDLCEDNQVQTLHLFGSVVDERRFHEESDIDILVTFKEELSLEEYTDCYFNLIFSLEELLERNIDITTARSLSNPYFIDELNATKVLFYEVNLTVEAHG